MLVNPLLLFCLFALFRAVRAALTLMLTSSRVRQVAKGVRAMAAANMRFDLVPWGIVEEMAAVALTEEAIPVAAPTGTETVAAQHFNRLTQELVTYGADHDPAHLGRIAFYAGLLFSNKTVKAAAPTVPSAVESPPSVM